ncbi:MAG: hypothetical protein ABI898_10205 [Sphingomonadales bacterium]
MPLELVETAFENDLDAILRLQSILLQAVEGARDVELDHEYRELRKLLLDDMTYSEVVPSFVRRNRTLDSLWPELKSFSPQWEPRRVEVRKQFEPTLTSAENLGHWESSSIPAVGYDSSAWTGAVRGIERVKAVKTLIPVAQSAVEQLIARLETPGHNGGPALDEVANALDSLRNLHCKLGELLNAAEAGSLAQCFNDGVAAEAARYAKRAARSLRDDPMPYALSATVLAILSACGVPAIAGYLAGVAVSMKKSKP